MCIWVCVCVYTCLFGRVEECTSDLSVGMCVCVCVCVHIHVIRTHYIRARGNGRCGAQVGCVWGDVCACVVVCVSMYR